MKVKTLQSKTMVCNKLLILFTLIINAKQTTQ